MVSFTACSSDDDVPSTKEIKNNIVGMWQTTHIAGWGYDDTEDENLIKVDQEVPEEKRVRKLVSFQYISIVRSLQSISSLLFLQQ